MKYDVYVKCSISIEIEAENEKEAQKKAEDMISECDLDIYDYDIEQINKSQEGE